MSKPFNIHDWQAKQRRLTEALNPEVSQKVNAFIKAMAKRYDYSEQDAVFAIMAALKQRNDTDDYGRSVSGKDKSTFMEPEDMTMAARARKMAGMDEHHAGDYNPGFLKQTVSTFLDKLKKKTDEGKDYETVEKIMEKHFSAKKKNEASMTGTGASFTPGTGAGYATPKAFGDNKNKKKKGYMGYKEI
tara:strand:+ start:50 stop:613 length:564 start_codon:yes stop_codon:yes gene_type:complete